MDDGTVTLRDGPAQETRRGSKVIRSTPVLVQPSLWERAAAIRLHLAAVFVASLVACLDIVVLGSAAFQGTLAVAGATLTGSPFAVSVCPAGTAVGSSSCVTGSAFSESSPSNPVSAVMGGVEGVCATVGIGALGQLMAAVSFAVIAAIRSYDEGELGRWVVCCEMRAKYVVPGVAAVATLLGVVGFAAVLVGVPGRDADGASVWETRSLGTGSIILLLSSLLTGLCVALAALGGKEVQAAQYERRLAQESAARRTGGRIGSGTAAVLAVSAAGVAPGRIHGRSTGTGARTTTGTAKQGGDPLLAGTNPLVGASV